MILAGFSRYSFVVSFCVMLVAFFFIFSFVFSLGKKHSRSKKKKEEKKRNKWKTIFFSVVCFCYFFARPCLIVQKCDLQMLFSCFHNPQSTQFLIVIFPSSSSNIFSSLHSMFCFNCFVQFVCFFNEIQTLTRTQPCIMLGCSVYTVPKAFCYSTSIFAFYTCKL